MTEDDTFLRLKGFTYGEALDFYTHHYLNFCSKNPNTTVQDAWGYIDLLFAPYGWTCKKMEQYGLSIK